MKITTLLAAAATLLVIVTSQDNCQKASDTKGENYRGQVAVTVSGRRCQNWDSQSPNKHDRTPENYMNSGLRANFCRNPDNEAGAWCYNDEGTDPRWEYCAIPVCPATEKDWTLKINCDDTMRLFIDGKKMEDPNLAVWHRVSTFVIPSTTRVIAATCVDVGGGYGLTASVTDSNGRDVLVTDESWKCSNTAEAGWETLDFEEGANWKAASIVDNRHLLGAASTEDGLFNMSPKRKVIWANPDVRTSHCRIVLDPGECSCDAVNNDSFDLKDIDYDIDNAEISEMPPTNAGKKTIENKTGQMQTTRYTVEKSVTETSSFSHTAGASITVGTTFEVGVPLIAMGSVSVSVSASYSYTSGQTKSEQKSVTADFFCKGAPRATTECQSYLFSDKIDVPYTMTWARKDDPSCVCTETGTYTKVAGHRIEMEAKEVGSSGGDGNTGEEEKKKKKKDKKGKKEKKDKKKKDKSAKKGKKKGI